VISLQVSTFSGNYKFETVLALQSPVEKVALAHAPRPCGGSKDTFPLFPLFGPGSGLNPSPLSLRVQGVGLHEQATTCGVGFFSDFSLNVCCARYRGRSSFFWRERKRWRYLGPSFS
jgi:hypothetical protein